MSDHQHLHGQRVGFHQVSDRRPGVENDFVGQGRAAGQVVALRAEKRLTEAPVPIVHRQTDGGDRIEHLLRADHLELIFVKRKSENALEVLFPIGVGAFEVGEDPLRSRQHGKNNARKAG